MKITLVEVDHRVNDLARSASFEMSDLPFALCNYYLGGVQIIWRTWMRLHVLQATPLHLSLQELLCVCASILPEISHLTCNVRTSLLSEV